MTDRALLGVPQLVMGPVQSYIAAGAGAQLPVCRPHGSWPISRYKRVCRYRRIALTQAICGMCRWYL